MTVITSGVKAALKCAAGPATAIDAGRSPRDNPVKTGLHRGMLSNPQTRRAGGGRRRAGRFDSVEAFTESVLLATRGQQSAQATSDAACPWRLRTQPKMTSPLWCCVGRGVKPAHDPLLDPSVGGTDSHPRPELRGLALERLAQLGCLVDLRALGAGGNLQPDRRRPATSGSDAPWGSL